MLLVVPPCMYPADLRRFISAANLHLRPCPGFALPLMRVELIYEIEFRMTV